MPYKINVRKYAYEARTNYGEVRGKHEAKEVHNFVRHQIELEKLKGKYAISRGNTTDKTFTKIDHALCETYAGVESPLPISGRLYTKGQIF